MRKRRAIALFGGFSFLLFAYFGWCVSPFFREPRFVFLDGIPPETQTVIREWRPYQTSPSARELFPEIMRNLANPYKVDRVQTHAWYFDENNVYLASAPFVASAKRKNGKWMVGPYDPVIVE